MSEKKLFPKNKMTVEIWFTNNFIANYFLLEKWKEPLFVLPHNKIVNKFFFLKLFLIINVSNNKYFLKIVLILHVLFLNKACPINHDLK